MSEPSGTKRETLGDDERRNAQLSSIPAFDEDTPLAAQLALDTRPEFGQVGVLEGGVGL